jgi:hypothetical protein
MKCDSRAFFLAFTLASPYFGREPKAKVAVANIPPTIDALAFADVVGEFFQIFELEFSVKSSKFFL